MIVKIKKPMNTGYLMYDNVVSFNYQRYEQDEPICLTSDSHDFSQETYIASIEKNPCKNFLSLERKDGNTIDVLAYGEVFILNDLGKTIDKF